jgi:hypothetical protein
MGRVLAGACLTILLTASMSNGWAQQSPWEKRQRDKEQSLHALKIGEDIILSGEEIRALISAKTMEEVERWSASRASGNVDSKADAVHYFKPDGTGGAAFGKTMKDDHQREVWQINEDVLCTKNSVRTRCGRLRRVDEGKKLYFDEYYDNGQLSFVMEIVSIDSPSISFA